MKRLFLLTTIATAIAFSLSSCNLQSDARNILEAEGYTNIKVTQPIYLHRCGSDDNAGTGFTATKNNRQIEGVVCTGVLKGSTVRVLKVHKPGE